MLKKTKLIFLILTQNSESTINQCIDSINSFADVIVVIDGFSSDNTRILLKKKKIKILKKKFVNCSNSLSFGMSYINKKYKNSIVFRLDSDEKLITLKSDKYLKSDFFNIILKKKNNVSILRKVVKNNRIISKDLTRFVTRVSASDALYNDLPMDEKIIGRSKKYYYIQIHDFLGPSIINHFKKHIQYAHLELETYLNKKFNNPQKKKYYELPIFLRSIAYGFFLLFASQINRNFLYNFIYQFIRGIIFRVYVDFLILKKKF
jgi:hypothetical protein